MLNRNREATSPSLNSSRTSPAINGTTHPNRELKIAWTRKGVKNVHLSVYPPNGRVTLVAPNGTRPEVARAYAISKLGWIRDQQAKLGAQARETPRPFIERESHYLWGRRYLLTVKEAEAKPSIKLDHRRILLTGRPGTTLPRRAELMHEWHKSLLHAALPKLISKWEPMIGLRSPDTSFSA